MLRASTGNGEAKELTCMAHGHELKGRGGQREWECWVEGDKGGNIEITVMA